jgi:hypothetical protein
MPIEGWLMLDKTTMKFSHLKPGDTDFKGEGLRDFFFIAISGSRKRPLATCLRNSSGRITHPKKAPVGTITVPTSTSCT